MRNHIPCTCDCHREGESIMHCEPCCVLCYQKYITKSGVVDLVKMHALLKETENRPVPHIDGGEYVVKNKHDYDTSYVKDSRKS